MCGIVGLVMKNDTGLYKKHEDVFFDSLYADAVRGWDSTGIIGVERDGAWHTAKAAMEATFFNSAFKGTDIQKDMWTRGKAYIGHNRKKTQGAINDANAHPFTIGNHFGMVHNGTLYNHKQLADTEVDSQALAIVLASAFDQDNHVDALGETLGKVNGAYAVAAYEQKKHHLYLFRNSERPLCIAETDDAWYWASEAHMLMWVLNRNSYDTSKVVFKAVPMHTLYTFDLNKTGKDIFTEQDIVVKKAQPVRTRPITQPAQTTKNGGGSNTVITGATEEVWSKNEFKRFKRGWLGKQVRFWAEDWVEDNFPSTEKPERVVLLGEVEDWDGLHTVKTKVDLAPLKLEANNKLVDRMWMGRVEFMELSKDRKSFDATLSNCKPILLSVVNKSSFDLDKMSMEALLSNFRHLRPYMSAAEEASYLQEIDKREGSEHADTYDNVVHFYKEVGVLLTQRVEHGVTRLINPMNGTVVYESAALVH